MKTRNLDIVSGVEIDYENGVYCLYGMHNNEITHYQFMDENGVWLYYCSSLDFIKDQTEEEVYSILIDSKPHFNVGELMKFTKYDFDKLYYYDQEKHTLRNIKGDYIAMKIKCPYIFILDSRESCQSILDSLTLEYLSGISIDIAYGGFNKNINSWVLQFEVNLPTDLYIRIVKKYESISDDSKNEIFESIKIKKDGKH